MNGSPNEQALPRDEQALPRAREAFDGSALLAAAGKGDRAAFVALFRHYAPRVKSYLLRLGADDSAAEEIVQSAFVTVWEKAKTFDPQKASASTWIFTVARNRRIDALRRDRFVDIDSDSHALANAAAETPEPYADAAQTDRLEGAIGELPEEQARLLRMAFFEDKSHSAIAKETHLPLGTVKSRLRLALGRLRARLKAEDAA